VKTQQADIIINFTKNMYRYKRFSDRWGTR